MSEFDKVLDSNEKIVWKGNPSFWPFLVGGSAAITIFGLIWMGFILCFAGVAMLSEGPLKYVIFATPHFWIGIAMLFGPIIYHFLVYKHTHYVITDKRIIIQKGVIGRDFEMIDFDQITNVDVNVGIADKLFGGNTGTVGVSSAGTFNTTKNGQVAAPYSFRNITNPYNIFKMLKKVSHDVKTDIEYPNKLRPNENPGYKSEYIPNNNKKS